MRSSLLAHARSVWLWQTALLTLVSFGLQACGTWKTVPLVNVESGKEALQDVDIRVKEKGSSSIRRVRVQVVDFPLMEGTESSGEEGALPNKVQIDLREVDEIQIFDPRTGLTNLAIVGGIVSVAGFIVLLVVFGNALRVSP